LLQKLFDPGFFIGHVLARDRVEFLDFNLVRFGALVLGRGVEMASAGAGFEFDFFSHDGGTLNPLAIFAQLGEHDFNALLVYGAQPGLRYTQLDPALFVFKPKTVILKTRHEAALRFVVGVRNVVPDQRPLACDLTNA
jgi:hypothetical protein